MSNRETIPMSLVKAVAELAESKDAISKRSYLLLKVLSILPQGESHERIMRIDHQHPFFPRNAEELLDRDLIQVRSSTTLIGNIGGSEDRIKILVAPRPVRDYVLTRMSSREIDSLVHKATTLYFGEQWRTGSATLRKIGNSLTSDDGSLMINPHTIVMRLLKNPATWNNHDTATATLNLCQIYCNALYSGKHYRNCVTVSRDVLSTIPETEFELHRNTFNILLARSLRMTGAHDISLPLIEKLLAIKQSKASKAQLLLEHALCLQSIGDKRAIEAAKEVIELIPDTAHAMQAQSVIIEMEHDADNHMKLLEIENAARKRGFDTVANNLALVRVKDSEDYSCLRMVHSTAVKAGDAYTAARAVVKLSTLSLKESGTLSNVDLNNLINAYQYFYGERFGTLFSTAHNALWNYFNDRSDTRNLLSLFRHSSFIWRLHGDENKEQVFVKQLSDSARQILATDILTADKNTAYFLIRARNEKINPDS